ncbi:MAG: tetratricopeptide repeat protein, partial [Thermoguttaceae bacterium]|nr:tetratricopeptide repeat protein [Thermoguttaceae bacterium]
MFVLNSPNRQAFDERLSDARASRLALAAALALCLVGLSCASGCVSSNATAASNNAQGVEYFTAGDYDNAIARFQDSLEENPESAETYYNLGSAFQRKANETGDLNLLTKAEDAYWTALQMNPAPETIVCCYRGIATSATARGDSAGAMQTLEEWRDRNPDSIEPRLEIAYLLEAQERDDDAYDALKEIAEMAPNDYRAFYKMGVLSERAGDLDDAIEQTNAAALLTSKSEIAQRARSLEAQYAAKQRKQEKEGGVEPPSTESTLAVGPIPASQTTRVQSTSAQAESEAV